MSVYPAALPTVRPAVRSAFEQGSGGGAASIIAGLFAAGQQGFWLPFTDFASLTQDSAGTLPYTALEQPVGRVLDRSGRGNHATQPTSTARGKVSAAVVSPPTRPYYLQLDGTDDSYTCGGGGSTTGFYFSDVVRPTSSTTTVLFSDIGTNSGYELAIMNTGVWKLFFGNGTGFSSVEIGGVLISALTHVAVWDDASNIYLQINGGTPVTVARGVFVAGTANCTLYRTNGSLAYFFNGQVTEPIYRAGPPPSAYERSVIRNYQMQKAGML